MSDQSDYAGMAALSICEALLLALNDHKLLPEHEITGVLRDAAATHENAAIQTTDSQSADSKTHLAVASLINRIIANGSLVRPS